MCRPNALKKLAGKLADNVTKHADAVLAADASQTPDVKDLDSVVADVIEAVSSDAPDQKDHLMQLKNKTFQSLQRMSMQDLANRLG